MSTWLCIPSARPPAEANPVLERWRQMGYKIALYLDTTEQLKSRCNDFHFGQSMSGGYPGYAVAVNSLVAEVMLRYDDAEWFVAAGDDTLPDPTHTANEIALECASHFADARYRGHGYQAKQWDTWSTFGVMQPTGDRFGQSPHFHPPKDRGDGIACGCGYLLSHPVHTGGAYIDRVAGSAWYGREYCRRMYGGNGPLWHEYKHMFVDTEARDVAVKMGVYWERRDLIQVHNHWSRELGAKAPAFLEEASGQAHWDKYKAIYEERKAAGFPGSEPL